MECYYDKKRHIIKEIAFYNVATKRTYNYFIKTKKPSNPTYYWLLKHHHLIPYNFGDTAFRTVIKKLNKPNSTFMVKDNNKYNILRNFTKNDIFILSNCPAYSELFDPNEFGTLTIVTSEDCLFNKHKNIDHCALHKVKKIAFWYGTY